MDNNELMHHGIKGMKWGVRKARGHAGLGRYATRKRQLAGDKRDLERLNNGQHLSVGLTKKRQAAYDKRDRANLEKRIAKNENRLSRKEKRRNSRDDWSEDAKTANDIKKKSVKQMSNSELKKLNERTRLEQEYSRLNPSSVQKGLKYVGAAAATLGTVAGLYNNSNTLIKAGKKIAKIG